MGASPQLEDVGSYVYEPPTPNLDLRPELDAEGQVIQTMVAVTSLVIGALAAVNRARLQKRKVDTDKPDPTITVKAYKTEKGFVVEERMFYDAGWTAAVSRRAREGIAGGQRTTHIRLTDLMKGDPDNIHDRVAGREKEGFAVVAQIDGNPHGVYMGAGVNKDGTLRGAHLEDVRPIAVRITTVGGIVSSEAPKLPNLHKNGLLRIPVHGMGLARYAEGEWAQTDILPSGAIGLDGFDATALQYAQEAFEGMVGVFDGENMDVFDMEANEERFALSCDAMQIPRLPKGQFTETIKKVLKVNRRYVTKGGMKSGDKFYIRPYAIGTKGGAGANAALEYLFAVEVTPFGTYLAPPSKGVAMEARLDIHRPESGTDKVGPNYAPGFAEKAAAKKRVSSRQTSPGAAVDAEPETYADYVSFDADGEVEEVSAAAVFGIERADGEGTNKTYTLRTPPTRREDLINGKHILPSTVRHLVLDLMKVITKDDELMAEMRTEVRRILAEKGITDKVHDFALNVNVSNISKDELPAMVGAFATGTAAGVTRIGLLDVKTSGADTQPVVCDYENDPIAIAIIRYLYDLVTTARTGSFTGKLASFNEKVTRVRMVGEDAAA